MLSDREAADRGLELLAWITASVEAGPEAARLLAPRGLDDEQVDRWGGVALIALRALYTRGLIDPDETVPGAFHWMRADWVAFRDDPPDERA